MEETKLYRERRKGTRRRRKKRDGKRRRVRTE